MEVAILLVTHIAAISCGFAFGRFRGQEDAKPKRGKGGRFVSK